MSVIPMFIDNTIHSSQRWKQLKCLMNRWIWINNIFNGKTAGFPVRLETRQGCPVSSFLLNTVVARADRQEKELKGIQIGREEVKSSVFTDDTILCVKNPEGSTKQLLELISEFSNVAGYKVNTQISCIFIH